MTLPDERYRAVLAAERLLKDLCDPSLTPRVPQAVRQMARHALRHYPGSWDMDRAAHACPEVFSSPRLLDDVEIFIIEGAKHSQTHGDPP